MKKVKISIKKIMRLSRRHGRNQTHRTTNCSSKNNYIKTYSDEDSFIQAVASWVEKQDEGKCMMRGAIRKFKIMSPFNVTNEDVEKEHGKRGIRGKARQEA